MDLLTATNVTSREPRLVFEAVEVWSGTHQFGRTTSGLGRITMQLDSLQAQSTLKGIPSEAMGVMRERVS